MIKNVDRYFATLFVLSVGLIIGGLVVRQVVIGNAEDECRFRMVDRAISGLSMEPCPEPNLTLSWVLMIFGALAALNVAMLWWLATSRVRSDVTEDTAL